MTTIKAVVRNGRIETTEAITFPEGTEVTITPLGPAAGNEPLCPWEPTLTPAEVQKRIADGGMTLAEFRAQAGMR